ncbi:potassium-transporting ATPase subunit KdpC [Paenibacillus sp. PAMC21692]|uniref:potassium-transporting ATPase subunit KdpC n=1 Tax=Paenibacillus sp. PAMC21692 TaxID=2762320 RepID=UPI00164DB7C1|nr:potassium-transporting ATPase subunit KdpC [Paenibacillus sp. PAMC21692]QNK55073.1 potassium-transporting ATPase subunit KdpC [Paenibacillus sp. PAMC21692]
MSNHTDQLRSGRTSLLIAIRAGVTFIVLCGLLYPLLCTGLAGLLMPNQAGGSLLKNGNGDVVGSELIGQKFTDPAYFHGRVSSIGYKAEASGSNNYAPSNPDLLARTRASIDEWKQNNPEVPIQQLPIALISNSGSGLDPHITPESAYVQVPRIRSLTNLTEEQLRSLVKAHTEDRDLGLFGEPRVNVLKLNMALQAMISRS